MNAPIGFSALNKSAGCVAQAPNKFTTTSFSEAGKVICAWGIHGCFMEQDKAVIALMDEAGVQPYVLGLTKYGFPNHPLYHSYGEAIKWNTPL